MKIHAASAVAPVTTHKRALSYLAEGLEDDVLGPISMEHVQLCPQHAGYIDEALLEQLMELYPATKFRLHASPKLSGHGRAIVHVSNSDHHQSYIKEAFGYGEKLGGHGHTIHAGERSDCDMEGMLDRLDSLQQRTGMAIGVEGLYPSSRDRWLMSTWAEHERVAERGFRYALDLSHLNIVTRVHGRQDELVRDLISSPLCMEVHVSGNDGRADSHKPLSSSSLPWWMDILKDADSQTVVFYEGILVDPRKKETKIGDGIAGLLG